MLRPIIIIVVYETSALCYILQLSLPLCGFLAHLHPLAHSRPSAITNDNMRTTFTLFSAAGLLSTLTLAETCWVDTGAGYDAISGGNRIGDNNP